MTYGTAEGLRTAIARRLVNDAQRSGLSVDRLRRRTVFERLVSRLTVAEPGRWVLKGGMALEVRLRDRARLTKDIDLGLRDAVDRQVDLRDRLVEALAVDPFADRFVFATGPVVRLRSDGAGHVTWRSKVTAELAGRQFGSVQLDVSPRPHELELTDVVSLPNSLAFAGIDTPSVEVIDVNRHAAEKFHAMTRDYGDRANSRVRDLVDLVILHENDQLDTARLRCAVRGVWAEREGVEPPGSLPALPIDWHDRYERAAAEHGLTTRSFADAVAVVERWWMGG